MRHLLKVAAMLAVISLTPATTQANIFGLFGFDCGGGHNCGCSNCGGCGGCGCGFEQSCCCEPACSCDCGSCCEPACGCGTGCYSCGRQYAGQMFSCGCKSYVPICPCTGPCNSGCCDSCGCGNCCEPACGCEQSCCCEPTCGTGCGSCCDPCRSHSCCLKHCGFCSCLGHALGVICSCNPCAGCNGETYWSEWHNDPPRCQDPCNCHGDYTGGCCPSCGPCNGGCGCAGASSCGCNSGGYAMAAPVRSNTTTNRAMVAQNNRATQQQMQQQQQMRVASRPVNRMVTSSNTNMQMNSSGQANANGQQARPIQW